MAMRPLENRVTRLLGVPYPIVQAPMGWIARTPLASAVSRAGGLGIIETSSGETANCQAEIRQMAALGLPFGVNLPIRFLKDDAMLRFVPLRDVAACGCLNQRILQAECRLSRCQIPRD